jgi:CheY-like chemotaxis protein
MKILLAEDARSVVQVMTSRLTSYGYDVVHAENGQLPSTSHSCLFSTTVSFHDG